MATIQTSVTMDPETYNTWKASGMRLGHLIKLGILAAKNNPQQIERIRELEEGNAKLQRAVSNALSRIRELEGR